VKYQSGASIVLGDSVEYNGQKGCIALVGHEGGSGSLLVKREEWGMNDSQILIRFDNGAFLMLDDPSKDDLLVFYRRKGS
jgi:hypothetical protein